MNIMNIGNAGDDFSCDVCGRKEKGYQMAECFVPAWAWKGRPDGYEEMDHTGFELNCLVDHGAGLGHGIVCRQCYHALYGAQGPQCYPFARARKDAQRMLRRHEKEE